MAVSAVIIILDWIVMVMIVTIVLVAAFDQHLFSLWPFLIWAWSHSFAWDLVSDPSMESKESTF